MKLSQGLLVFGFIFIEYHASADQELDEILLMDLDDLMVSVASKREESISDAPGIMNVVTSDDIRLYGARNLRDILDRQPNMQIVGSNVFPHNAAFIRGGGLTHADNTNLLLLNGRPIRESHGGGINTDIYRNFPIASIKRIEIIRGPGSVLYGTNAFNGVINIVTKQERDSSKLQASVDYGSFNSKSVNVSGGGTYGELTAHGGISYLNSNGWDWSATDEAGVTQIIQNESSGYETVITADFKGITFNSIIGNNSIRNVGSAFLFPGGTLNHKRQFIDLGYRYEWDKDWNSSANVTYNGLTFTFPTSSGAKSSEFVSQGYLVELTTQGSPTDNINVVFGGVFDQLDGRLGAGTVSDYDTWRSSVYAQADYTPTNWLKLITGVQWNKPKGLDWDTSPRLGTIVNFDDNWGSKVLYGEAFRTAFGADSFFQAPFLVGNSSLEPEKISTFDAQLFYSTPKHNLALTYYRSNVDNVHTRIPGFPSTFTNGGEIKSKGVELESKIRINQEFNFVGSATYQINEDGDGNHDVQFSPNLMIKTGLSYDSGAGISSSIFNNHFGDAASLPGSSQVNSQASSYNLLTVNIILNLQKLLNQRNTLPIVLSLYGDNLLDEDIHFPSFNRPEVNTLPHHSGRAVYATVMVKI